MEKEIQKSVVCLKRGEAILFPTETVYALACDATNDSAVKKIYDLKNRDYSKPLAIFFKDVENAKKYLVFNKQAEILAEKFMPGELTLVLKKKKNTRLSKYLNVNDDTLGFRIPNHKFCLALLEKFGKPICATSANITGEPPLTKRENAVKYFDHNIFVAQREDEKSSNVASTIVDLSGKTIKFIREGKIIFQKIREELKNE